MRIKIEQSTEILNVILNNKIASESKSLIELAFDSMLEFKADYDIENCLIDEETDELFAEYGTYNWNQDEDPKFGFTFIRQIQLELEEYHHIKLKLTFNHEDFKGIESANFWAMDFQNIAEWKSEIEKTNGYNKAKQTELLNLEITLDTI